MKDIEKYRRHWIWWQDLSTLFTSFATILATWLVFMSLIEMEDMWPIAQSIVKFAASAGIVVLPVPIVILGIWIFILIVRRARGKLINQQLKKADIQNQVNKNT